MLLDNRITKQRYGQVFFDSLPDYGFTTKIDEVEKFFQCLKFPSKQTFAAGHALRNYHGKCENVHGHNYRVPRHSAGENWMKPACWSISSELKRLMRAVKDRLDHQFLNDLPPFDVINPSAENIAKYFHDEIHPHLTTAKLTEIKLWETDVACATFRPA